MPAAKTPAAQPVNQLSIIRAGRWKSATFTTFTFNAAFFEAYVLPRLHEAGCEEVTVLVDELFYLASLAEQPRHAGTAYRLVPVAMEKGVFHAKLTYLQGAEGRDVCMVGSGNLTWPGFGHQLECLDVLDSATEGQAFHELAAILRALLRRRDFRAGDAAIVLERVAKRSIECAGRAGARGMVRLLAPVEKPISEQVAELLSGKTFRELVAVSPFHVPDGGPCMRLAARLGIQRVRVAVDTASGETPLKQNIAKVQFVQLANEEEARPTHAKWYELRGEESWLLSGSVNATQTSLESVANFELATLRPVPTHRLPRWQQAEPAGYLKGITEFARAPDGEMSLSVTARGRHLVGSFLWSGEVDGEWRASLNQAGLRLPLGQVSVLDGGFEIFLDKAIDTEPCQVHLQRGKHQAKAWVMFEAELRMSSAEREFARKVRRLDSAEAAPDDFVAVLGWLAERIGRIGGAPSPRGNESPPAEDDSVPDKTFNYEKWSMGAGAGGHAPHSLLGNCQTALRALAQYTRNVAEGHALNRESGEGDFGQDATDNAEERENTVTEQRMVDAMLSLEKALRRTLEDGVPEAESASFMLEALLWTLVLQDRQNRQAALDSVPFVQWSSVAAPYVDRFAQNEGLATLSLANCACGFSLTAGTDARRERFAAIARRLAGDISGDRAREIVSNALHVRPCFSLLRAEDRDRIASVVEAMLTHEGFGAKLSAYLESAAPGSRFPAPPSDLVSQTGGLLAMLANKTSAQQQMKEWKSELPKRCSDRCYHQFDSSDMSVLRNRRAVRCIQCGTLHFWTGATA